MLRGEGISVVLLLDVIGWDRIGLEMPCGYRSVGY